MSGALVAALVVAGLGIVVVRRRTVAIALVAAQSLMLGIGALSLAAGREESLVAGVVLLVKAGALPALLLLAVRRTREPRLVAAAAPGPARLAIAATVALAVAATVPPLGLEDPTVARAAFALVAIGAAIVVLRRPALFQALGLLAAENGVYLLAVSAPGGMPFVIELGVLFDLMLVMAVAVGFAHRIHGAFGTGDTEQLRGLRD